MGCGKDHAAMGAMHLMLQVSSDIDEASGSNPELIFLHRQNQMLFRKTWSTKDAFFVHLDSKCFCGWFYEHMQNNKK